MRFALSAVLAASLLAACGGSDDAARDVRDTADRVAADTERMTERAGDSMERMADRASDTAADMAQAARLMVGEWNQDTNIAMSAAGQSFTIMNGTADYDADGTSEIEAMLVVDGLPGNENTYRIELDGEYTLNGKRLTERFTAAEVTPINATAKTNTIAKAIQTALGGAGETTSTVVSIDDGVLVRNVPGVGELRYTK